MADGLQIGLLFNMLLGNDFIVSANYSSILILISELASRESLVAIVARGSLFYFQKGEEKC